MKALLALEDGRVFPCSSFTGPGEAGGEVVFNTSMTGYQEILTDPSYNSQIVTMTYPLIGNYGVNPVDVESSRIQVAAFLIREYQAFPSNFRSTRTLADYLKDQGVLGLENLDTRALTRHIRNAGAMKAFISTKGFSPKQGTFESSAATYRVKQIIAAKSTEIILLVDHTKFCQKSLCKVFDISQIDVVFTDDTVSKTDKALLEREVKKVIVCKLS